MTTQRFTATHGLPPPPDQAPILDQALIAWLRGMESRIGVPGATATPDRRRSRPRGWQDEVIEKLITKGASVLDLGCGDGQLLERLIKAKNVRAQGMEIDAELVMKCVERGVPVVQRDLDDGLSGFPDHSFDYVVLEETLQTLNRPHDMLSDMLRVGRRGIVSFPNMAFWRVRMELAIVGRMPSVGNRSFRWFETPNIHPFTLQDFLDWAQVAQVHVVKGWVLSQGEVRQMRAEDNLLAEEVVLVIDREKEGGTTRVAKG